MKILLGLAIIIAIIIKNWLVWSYNRNLHDSIDWDTPPPDYLGDELPVDYYDPT